MKLRFTLGILAATAIGLAACASSTAPTAGSSPLNYQAPSQPEGASGYTEKPGWATKTFAVAAANPLATDAGYQVLKAGGSAVDAAIAVQLVLTLVEPQSSGIGGGAFLLHFDGKKVQAFDGRETAPMAADEKLFLKDGKPVPFYEGVVGGRSVGTPGVLRMLEVAHKQHGKLAWASLFGPAITLAEQGFKISPRLHMLLASEQHLKKDATAAAYFYNADGTPKAVGAVLKNPELAAVLREIASKGVDVFYRGQIARDIVAKVRAHPLNPGLLAESDFAAYQAKVREPVCSDYRQYRVCGFPPPSSGGIAIAQMLGMLEPRNLSASVPVSGVPSADAVHLISEVGRLAYADRGLYVADTDFVPLPGGSWASLIDKAYLQDRAKGIASNASGKAQPGMPRGATVAMAHDRSPELPSTSHISIVDAFGNALSMTTTIEDVFGSRQMVRGFLLNNQLTDFSFVAEESGKPVANRVQPGKRPRSSMAPTLVFDKTSGQLVMSAGSPGGSLIINYVAKVLVGTLDWGLNVQQAISLPNFGSRNLGDRGATELERGRFSAAVVEQLKQRGHDVREIEQTSGLQAIQRTRDGWFGGADPRREGVVMGQ
jgi:gamma-glutamyltranspeptidase/glutathione hydrolase